MEERFLALTGNEFGVHLDECAKFLTREEAQEVYNRYVSEYGCASLHELKDGALVRIQMETEL